MRWAGQRLSQTGHWRNSSYTVVFAAGGHGTWVPPGSLKPHVRKACAPHTYERQLIHTRRDDASYWLMQPWAIPPQPLQVLLIIVGPVVIASACFLCAVEREGLWHAHNFTAALLTVT